ncbi:MAG: hypothetical protein HQL31_13360, partial [Planctomycetes bacterium]|nr:hypothetical protein [Planctomycetota bacterium]
SCTESMRLVANLGYDGPVKVWLDGRAIHFDPEGTNPAAMFDASLPLQADKGKHELMIALLANCGLAWGIFLHFERLGVPLRLRKAAPGAYAMPVIY